MHEIVSIVKISSYKPQDVHNALETLLQPLGGIKAFVKQNEKVLLKPNFLAPKSIDAAVCTHPEIIRQVANFVSTCQPASVKVTDSPGIGTAKQCAKKIGLQNSDLFTIEDSSESLCLNPPKEGLQKLNISRLVNEADSIINIPKAKTHGQMIITAAAKNTFGAVCGLEKAQWHYRIGKNLEQFAQLLIHIHEMVKPRLNILDGIIGMQGNGPGSGTPAKLGLLMASANAHALDYVLCKIWGINPEQVYTIAAAQKAGLLPDEKNIQIVGPSLDQIKTKWEMATPKGIQRLIGPAFLAPLWEKLLKTEPVIDNSKCTLCMVCSHHCAAGAISEKNSKLKIDYKKCISCFCCQEMCPHGAIKVATGPLAKLLISKTKG
jgi:uncharacterized protein (DUF362 family)/Pyruvate/2-oxoacid:ferredoxin oxidoreductase delta subunit